MPRTDTSRSQFASTPNNFHPLAFALAALAFATTAAPTPAENSHPHDVRAVVPVRANVAQILARAATESLVAPPVDIPSGKPPAPQAIDIGTGRPVAAISNTRPTETRGEDQPAQRSAQPLVRSFLAEIDNGTVWPPDTHGAIGPNHAVTLLNSGFAVRNKSGGFVLSQIPLAWFWLPVGGSPGFPGYLPFDPRILYDQYAQRWVAVSSGNPNNQDGSGASWLLVAVSETTDPTGFWNYYAFEVFNPFHFGDWLDDPSLGLDRNNYIIAGNIFQINGPFRHSDVYIFDKSKLIAGVPVAWGTDYSITHDPCGDMAFSYQSCHSFLPVNHQYSDENFLISEGWTDVNTRRLRYIRFNPIFGIGAAATVLCAGQVGLTEVGCYNFYLNDGPQPSGCASIEAGVTRLTSNAVLRMDPVTEHPYLWLTHTVGVVASGNCPTDLEPPSRPEIRWYQFDAEGIPDQRIVQWGQIGNPLLHYFYPSIAVNKFECVLLGFSGSSVSNYGSAFYTTRMKQDPPYTMQPVALLKAGVDPYRKLDGYGRNRWGDYSATCVDPADDQTLWTVQEYAYDDLPQFGSCNEQSSRWSTWWGAVSCGPAPLCPCPGNINGPINGLQINAFLNCLLGGPSPAPPPRSSGPGLNNCACADMNQNGIVDTADITLFVNALTGVAPPNPGCP